MKNMKRRLTLFALMAAMVCQMAQAQDVFTTKGDGTTYSIKGLAQIAEAGVESLPKDNGNAAPPKYGLTKSITIAEGDRFEMESNLHVLFAKDVRLTIEGEADFSQAWSVYDVYDENEQTAASIRLKSKAATFIDKCVFRHLGVEVMGEGAVQLRACSFLKHNGSTAAALYFISAGAAATIEACIFEDCQKAAIGSAANASQPMTINDCVIMNNSLANSNIPQINITAANPVNIIGGCVIGNTENTMVGGIGISNFMGYDADITIRDCQIEDNRYGIGLVGPAAHIHIDGNTLKNNRYEVNPMNGGSGISLYDPYGQTEAILTGNYIEGSLWGVTVIGCKDVNLGCIDKSNAYNPGGNVFKDNGNNGQLYDLYNNSTITVYAQGNTWNVSEQTEEQIETVIFHKNDNPALGQVIYMPAANTTSIKDIHTNVQNTAFYDLQGRKTTVLSKGIYIVNGKKVVR